MNSVADMTKLQTCKNFAKSRLNMSKLDPIKTAAKMYPKKCPRNLASSFLPLKKFTIKTNITIKNPIL